MDFALGTIYFGVLPFSMVYISFIINAFPFGIDQLHDASTIDSVSYIMVSSCYSILHWRIVVRGYSSISVQCSSPVFHSMCYISEWIQMPIIRASSQSS